MTADLIVLIVAAGVPVICLLAAYGIISTIRELEHDREEQELRLARR